MKLYVIYKQIRKLCLVLIFTNSEDIDQIIPEVRVLKDRINNDDDVDDVDVEPYKIKNAEDALLYNFKRCLHEVNPNISVRWNELAYDILLHGQDIGTIFFERVIINFSSKKKNKIYYNEYYENLGTNCTHEIISLIRGHLFNLNDEEDPEIAAGSKKKHQTNGPKKNKTRKYF